MIAQSSMPSWRSLLFVGADRPDRIARIGERGADAVILDLEDAVPPDAKAAARDGLPAAIEQLRGASQAIVVRINGDWRRAGADLAAAIQPGVSAIMVPGCEHVSRLETLAEMIGEWEVERDLKAGSIGLIALVESPAGIGNLATIACAPRIVGLALGTEDLALNMGVPPSAALLDLPARLIALAARASGIMALAVPISIAEYSDVTAYQEACKLGSSLGVTGAICIHPIQVAVANDAFRPSDHDVADAKAVLAAWADRGESGILALDGRMVDLPVVERARRLLASLTS